MRSCPVLPPPPETTALYEVFRQHLESYITLVRQQDGHRASAYVELESQRYLDCGILCYGFACARF